MPSKQVEKVDWKLDETSKKWLEANGFNFAQVMTIEDVLKGAVVSFKKTGVWDYDLSKIRGANTEKIILLCQNELKIDNRTPSFVADMQNGSMVIPERVQSQFVNYLEDQERRKLVPRKA
ncbi:MAG: hypothetical protein ABII22_01895 [Candidatus Micrarchaeota archaeon]